ncbi:uncharacterized protein BYT42DRAFT_37841 [Radiomyces spectabilis]|uniref:uncharacterized protein n=1 Tax=Radiomyces spectabilis TaxID=64574 RepID=UPI00221EBB4D|nr:uncharacterized protein BYT42DRAFT_37841 [Radiomyces spectabilis]KAI8394268.1 hypothetical protein BYT42DRAFT_37841 [Radiomyces spectabilis]
MAFYRRLIGYGLSVLKHHSISPVVLVIIIHNTTTQLANPAVISEKQPYLLELPCDSWAKSCNILNASSISDHLQHTPLNPLVALGYFFFSLSNKSMIPEPRAGNLLKSIAKTTALSTGKPLLNWEQAPSQHIIVKKKANNFSTSIIGHMHIKLVIDNYHPYHCTSLLLLCCMRNYSNTDH